MKIVSAMMSKTMFISGCRISGILLAGTLVLHGCSDDAEKDVGATEEKQSIDATQQQYRPVYNQAPGGYRPQNQSAQSSQQYGGGYGENQPQYQGVPTHNTYAPTSAGGNTSGNPWLQQGGAAPSTGTFQGMNPQQAPGVYPPTGYQQRIPQYQYRPLESSESKGIQGTQNQQYPAPRQYRHPSYIPPAPPYGAPGIGGGYPGYSPYGGYGPQQPGFGMPSIGVPGIW